MRDIDELLTVYTLPETLLSKLNYNELASLQPDNYSKVMVRDKVGEYYEKTIFRKYLSYLKTPSFSKETGKSYMFSDESGENIRDKLPEPSQPIYDFIKSKSTLYNQCIINWYPKGTDYIELHTDCDHFMLDTYDIAIVNLNENPDEVDRDFVLQSRDNPHYIVKYPLKHGQILEMNEQINRQFRHGVLPGKFGRISLTFRQMK